MVDLIPQPEKENDSSAFDNGSKMQIKPLGVSGTEIYGGYFSEEYLQKLRGRQGAKIFDEMRRSESQISMLMNAVKNPIKAASWEFEVAEGVADGERHAELVKYCLTEMVDFETFLHEALSMIDFGYSVLEVINNVVFDNEKFGTFNGLKALAFRSQKTIERWNVDSETGNLKTVDQYAFGDLAPSSTMKTMLAEFLLIFTLQKEGDNYEGISALRPMYGPYFRKNLYQKLTAIGVEKNAVGTPIGTVPKTKNKKEDEDNFKKVLSNFTSNESAYLVKPEGWLIEIIRNDFDPSKIKELILLENTEMINCLVANFLALGTNGGGGAYALGSDLSDFFLTGLQNYARLIAGILNRKLIPDLVKLNFGPQAGYPKLKATNINDKAGKELAEIVKSMVDGKVIKPDDKLEESMRSRYNLPKADPTTARAVEAPKLFSENLKLSETRLQLAEGYKTQWKNNKDSTLEVMQEGLNTLLELYKTQIQSKYKNATPAARQSLGLQLEPRGVSNYKAALREELARVAAQALAGARKETPKAKNVKLSEIIKLAAPRGGYFEALPPNVKRLVKTQADLIAENQASDMNKIVSFQYQSSQASTEDIDQILLDIDEAVLPVIEGSTAKGTSIDAAAGNAVSQITNQARLEWFFEPEVLDTIESFTFYNEDPVSEICQELDGTTWAVNDPDLDRYSPPLHHNCKSRLVPNEKGADKNPKIQRGGTAVTQKALDSITLCECSYHLEFKLKEMVELTKAEQDLVSAKIAKLVGEGKSQEQAAAIAYDMLRRGELG
jgi:hypothetical protein